MKKSFLVLFLVALTSSSFAGTVGMVNGKPGDCSKLNNSGASSIVTNVNVADVTPAVIINSTDK